MIRRKTKKVETLINLFEQKNEALSVVDLTNRLSTQMNKTTVYRILDRLEQSGVVHSFNDSNGLRWYAKCNGCSATKHTDTHPHFQCTDCGTIECLSMEIPVPSISNRQINSVEIMLKGTCERCIS
ncbi:transcriptional regulator [Leptobacterium flavescens]|uniref:Transcriptional regulator n=1 Tax=Leptobacterium flavescens TaxID=472055 RepID=A0A6P0USC1_9FLAO|nr:transcriptional repressor [Leptobacterium flavescens]NER14888.1 transcriptional regulator [Leptobacterium flavescens]